MKKSAYTLLFTLITCICLGQNLSTNKKYQRLLQSNENFKELVEWQESVIKQKEIDIQVSKNMIQLMNQEKTANTQEFLFEFMKENKDNNSISVTMHYVKGDEGIVSYACIAESLIKDRKVITNLSGQLPFPGLIKDGHITINVRVDNKGSLTDMKIDKSNSTLAIQDHLWAKIKSYLNTIKFEESKNVDFEAGTIVLNYLFYK
jgi:hypothetical protein